MTGYEIYNELIGELSDISTYPVQISPNQFLRVLTAVMSRTHDRVSIYHRRYSFTLAIGERYNTWPSVAADSTRLPQITNILSASYHERPLKIILPLQYPGPTETSESWSMDTGEPKSLWMDVLLSTGDTSPVHPIRIGVDPVPPTGSTYIVHAMMQIPLPSYTNWLLPLPTTDASHRVIADGVLAKFYDLGKTFHENVQKQRHAAAYEAGVQALIPLIQRNERQPNLGATSARYVTARL